MLNAFVLDGTITLLALCALAVELALILSFAAARRKAPSIALIANLLSGFFLILALRAALLEWGGAAIAALLALAGAAHMADAITRMRQSN